MDKYLRCGLIVLLIALSGCSTNAKKALQMSSFEETLGTNTPTFFMEADQVDISIENYGDLSELVAKDICEKFNMDKDLEGLVKHGLIDNRPTCSGIEGSEEHDIRVVLRRAVGCLIRCLETTILYIDGSNNTLTEFTVENTVGPIGMRTFAVGHMKNLLIASAIIRNRDDPSWSEKLKSFCNNYGNKTICG